MVTFSIRTDAPEQKPGMEREREREREREKRKEAQTSASKQGRKLQANMVIDRPYMTFVFKIVEMQGLPHIPNGAV